MKYIKRACQLILLTITIFLWIFFIGGADSLLENNLLFITLAGVAFATYCCHLLIKTEDIEEIFHTKMTDNEV